MHKNPCLDPHVDVLHVGEEGLPVVVPVGLQVLVLGVLVAAQLQGDLEVVGPDVVPVLHGAQVWSLSSSEVANGRDLIQVFLPGVGGNTDTVWEP